MTKDCDDPFDLDRFVRAQDGIYEMALDELRRGRKSGHWMWFVFPQMKGLGASANATYFGIGSLEEAQAYLAHPVLGARLKETTRLMRAHRGNQLRDILGNPDDLKFCSSMTLFSCASGPGSDFEDALDAFCGGDPDPLTLRLLANA